MKKLYRHNDKLYIILKELPEHKVNGKDGFPNLNLLKDWRDWIGADHVLRLANYYLLCETIQDLEYEEINEKP